MREIKFKACKFLDFQDNYTAKKVLIGTKNGNKVSWERPIIDSSYPPLVQFCTKRGRLNSPEMCLCKSNAQCSDYSDFNHCVNIKMT
jgi:hypothetical protein